MHHSGGGQQHLASCSISRSPKNPSESRTKNAAPPTARQPCQPSCNFLGDWKSGLEHFHPSQKVFSFRKPQKNCEFTRPPWTNLTRLLGKPTCLLVPFPGDQKPNREHCSALIEKPAAKFISKLHSNSIALLQALLLAPPCCTEEKTWTSCQGFEIKKPKWKSTCL